MARTDIVEDNNSNVKFLLGTQESLAGFFKNSGETGKKTAENGAFYLTQDTHRLYIGLKDGKVAPVNEGVTTVANVSALSAITANGTVNESYVGNFYYAQDENILCVWNGKNWIQINNDTNSYVVRADTSIAKDTSVPDLFAISTTLTRAGDNGQVTHNFKIAGQNVTLTSTAGTYDANGIRQTPDILTITGLKNDSFSVATTGSNNKEATVTLKDSGDNTVAFKIKAGDRVNVKQADSTTDTVEISAENMYNTGIELIPIVDENDANATGYRLQVKDAKGIVENKTTIDPKIKIGAKGDTNVGFVNGVATLDVYTKSEVDAIEKALNSMTYRGITGSAGGENVSNYAFIWNNSNIYDKAKTFKIGDVYLFDSDVTFTPKGANESITINAGSLAIAKAADPANDEDADGYLKADKIQWDYVAATANTDTQYNFQLSNDAAVLHSSLSRDADKGSIKIAGGTAIKTSASVDADHQENITFTVTHDNVDHTATETAVSQAASTYNTSTKLTKVDTEVSVIKNITVNDQGHVTTIETGKLTLTDTNAQISSVTTTLSAAESNNTYVAGVKTGITLKDGQGKLMPTAETSYTVESSSLKITSEAANGTVAPKLKVDLVWGSF